MSRGKPFTEDEIEYIQSMYPRVGPTEIARRLNRSVGGIKRQIKVLGLQPYKPMPEMEVKEAEPPTTLERLIELRAVLRRQMLECPIHSLPGISREYRGVIADIERLEQETKPADANPLDQIAKGIADAMRTQA